LQDSNLRRIKRRMNSYRTKQKGEINRGDEI
jgi:hypothetical protein